MPFWPVEKRHLFADGLLTPLAGLYISKPSRGFAVPRPAEILSMNQNEVGD